MMEMEFGNLLTADSKLFAKSEFEPASSYWPAVSFSSKKIANELHSECRRGKDFVLFVGTSNSKDTPNPAHRQRLMSVVELEPRAVISTKDLVSEAAWLAAQEKYPGRWDFSLVIAKAWDVEGLPRAHDVIPETYKLFQNPGTRGHPIPVTIPDVALLQKLKLAPVELSLSERARKLLAVNVPDELLRKHLSRLTDLIQTDIARSNQAVAGRNPERFGPSYSDIFGALSSCWERQQGLCALCETAIPLDTKNKLLQLSRDRIDSSNKGYLAGNVQLTHCGCNLAKSDATMAEWFEYRKLVFQHGAATY